MREKKRKNGKSRRGDSSRKRPAVSRSRTKGLSLVAAAVCACVAGYFLVRHAFFPPGRKEALPPDDFATRPVPEAVEDLKAEGLEVARLVMKEFPGRADPILLMGQVHYRLGDTAQAITFWNRGLKLNPDRADAYDGMGWIALRKGDYQTAASRWQKALEIDPKMQGVRNSLARALLGLGRHEDAVSALEEDVRLSPRSSMSYFLLGQTYLQLQKFDKAREAYAKTIEIDPACTNAYYGLASVLTRLGEREKAKESMKKFQELKAEDMKVLKDRNTAYDDMVMVRGLLAMTHDDAARVYRKYGKIRRAEQHWQRAAVLDPKNVSCRLQLAALYDQVGSISEAVRMYEEVRQLEPERTECRLRLVSIYSQTGRFVEAEEILRETIKLEPERSWGYRELARLHLNMKKDVREAKVLAERAVELEPVAANYDVLGWAFYANGEVSRSLWAMEQAIKLDPGNAEYKRRYNTIRQRQSDVGSGIR